MYRFLLCDLVTGRVLDELPIRIGSSGLTRVLSGIGSGTLELLTVESGGAGAPACPSNWSQTILPWRSLIVVTEGPEERIVWGGVPTNRPRTLDSVVSFPCVTVEAYLARRYVPDMAFYFVDQTLIARDLAAVTNTAGIGLEFDCPPSGVLRERAYSNDEDGKVLERLDQLAAVIDGFEWTVDLQWGDTKHSLVRKIFRTGYPQLGRITPDPDHVFELPGAVTGIASEEPWTEGEAATHVTATGDADGPARMSNPAIDTDRETAGWPRLEERSSFQGVTEKTTLDSHARALADVLFGGQHVVTVVQRSDEAPTVAQLTLGDSARIKVDLPHLVIDEVWRVVGWKLTPERSSYEPVLGRI